MRVADGSSNNNSVPTDSDSSESQPPVEAVKSAAVDVTEVAEQTSASGTSSDQKEDSAKEESTAATAEQEVAKPAPPTVESEEPARDEKKLEQMSRWREKIREIDSDKMATDLKIGGLTLRDILSTITRPTRDPRESLPKPIFLVRQRGD